MSRKKNDDDSSLELLLDTMSNTFGGVMFIAIALVVLMSMLSNASSALQAPEQELKALESELSTLLHRSKALQKALKELEKHPAYAQISEIMRLQKELAATQIKTQLLQTQKTLAEQTAVLQQKRVQQALQLQAKIQSQREKLEQELKDLQAKLDKIGKTALNSTDTMTFRVMESSFDQPYILIVAQDRIWRVGPETDKKTGRLRPHEGCTAESAVIDGQKAVVCRPVQGKGTPILFGQSISQEAVALLSSLPPQRVPLFSLAKDSFQSFCLLRDYMTKQKIRHGVNLEFEHFKSCVYRDDPEKKSYDY